MRKLALALVLAVLTPAATAQRQQQPQQPQQQQPQQQRQQPQQPATKPGPVKVEPNWAEVRSSQRSGQVQNLDQLQGAIRQYQRPNQKPGELLTKLGDFTKQSASVNAAVLIPLSAARAETTSLVTGKTYYNFSASYPGGMTSTVLGQCSGVRLPDNSPIVRNMQAEANNRPVLPGLGARYQISPTETGHQLTFSKFGCAYEIAVTCEACTAEKELVDMASSMAVINAR